MNEKLKKALGPLVGLYEDASVQTILVDAPNQIYVEKESGMEDTELSFANGEELQDCIEKIFATVGRPASSLGPYADIRLSDGTNVKAMFPPATLANPALVIAKVVDDKPSWKDLLSWQCLDVNGLEIIDKLLVGNVPIVVAGNYGSGKTTLTSLIVDRIPQSKRVVVAEQNAEVRLERERVLRLETTPELPMEELLKSAVRLRPEWLVVNELVGSETKTALELMRTGCPILATVNAGDVLDALARIEQMTLSSLVSLTMADVRSIISSAVSYVVYIERLSSGARKILEISEITGLEKERYKVRPLYRYSMDDDKFIITDKGKTLLAAASK